jgi:hypothetical protein
MVVVVVVLAYLGGNGADSSPDHRSSSDAYDGTSALRLYAQALGHSTTTLEGSFELPGTPGLLFVFSPTDVFTGSQADAVKQWVSRGGVLVYAAESWDVQLEGKLGLQRLAQIGGGPADARAPILGGVRQLKGADSRTGLLPFKPATNQVPLIRGAGDAVLALSVRVGQGQVVALADPLWLCNGYLDKADNGRLAADLIALEPAGGRVFFDEFHHGAAASSSPQVQWLLTPWGAGLGWAVAVVFIGLALRGRAFGPRIPISVARDRSTAEYTRAVGNLLWRTGARKLTWGVIDTAARRSLGQRIGISVDPNTEQFAATAAERAPALYKELASVETRLDAAGESEAVMLEAARRLHELAYPHTVKEAG